MGFTRDVSPDLKGVISPHWITGFFRGPPCELLLLEIARVLRPCSCRVNRPCCPFWNVPRRRRRHLKLPGSEVRVFYNRPPKNDFWPRHEELGILRCNHLSVGGCFKYFLFSTLPGQIGNLANIFQMGWNHQLVQLIKKQQKTCCFFNWLGPIGSMYGIYLHLVDLYSTCRFGWSL